MFIPTVLAATLLTASQPAPDAPAGTEPQPVPITELSQLPVGEAAGPRCGVVFALVDVAQRAGDEQATQWPDLQSGNGREFFVRAVAKLMEDRALTREQVDALLSREARRLRDDDLRPAYELMPPCLLMKQAAGL